MSSIKRRFQFRGQSGIHHYFINGHACSAVDAYSQGVLWALFENPHICATTMHIHVMLDRSDFIEENHWSDRARTIFKLVLASDSGFQQQSHLR
jgi:hypothetical protein